MRKQRTETTQINNNNNKASSLAEAIKNNDLAQIQLLAKQGHAITNGIVEIIIDTDNIDALKLMLDSGCSLFKDTVNPQTHEEQVDLTFNLATIAKPQGDRKSNLTNYLAILNFYAIKQLLNISNLSLKHMNIANYLHNISASMMQMDAKDDTLSQLKKVFSENHKNQLSRIRACLSSMKTYLYELQFLAQDKAQTNSELLCLAKAIVYSPEATVSILSSFVDKQIFILPLMLKALFALPRFTIRDQMCRQIADKLFAAKKYYRHAKKLYEMICPTNHPEISAKITECNMRIIDTSEKEPEPETPSTDYQNALLKYIINYALSYNIKITIMLVEEKLIPLDRPLANQNNYAIECATHPKIINYILNQTCDAFSNTPPSKAALDSLTFIIQHIKHSASLQTDQYKLYLQRLYNSRERMTFYKSIERLSHTANLQELVLTFIELLTHYNQNPGILQNYIKESTPKQFDVILLCLLLTRSPEDKIRLYLGTCLNTLQNNNPKKLLIISHILTYYEKNISKPQQVKAIFIRALAEEANIDYHDKMTINSLVTEHPKRVLLAIRKIRLELVKLTATNYPLTEAVINHQSSNNNFLQSHNLIANIIEQLLATQIQYQKQSLSTFVLDQIEEECIYYYNEQQSNYPNEKATP